LLFASPLASQTCDLLQKVRGAVNQAKPFAVEFTQQVYFDTELSIEESGLIKFKDIKKIRWEYQDPDVKIAVIHNDQYKFYEEDTNQLTIGSITGNKKKWIWQLLFADDLNDSISCDNKKKIIYIKDKKEEMDFEVHVGGGYLLTKVVHRDPTGALNVYLFSGYKKNVTVSPADFDIAAPDDVEIIHAEDL
jgi:outer membrane lipoprotein-sorting protein